MINYLKTAKAKNSWIVFPYDWAEKYLVRKIDVRKDKNTKSNYICADNKKIYFPPNYYKNRIEYIFNRLCVEMDYNSPHRYLTADQNIIGTINDNNYKDPYSFGVKEGDVVADIGVAEGNFAICIVDIASHVYLFECDPVWMAALKNTFRDYTDKITIINKSVSDIDDEHNVTLDTFFKDKKIDFIKADVEGFEQKLLDGAKETFSNNDIRAATCAYHKPNDLTYCDVYFKKLGYQTDITKNYMFFSLDNAYKNFQPDLFRRGVLRAQKSNFK